MSTWVTQRPAETTKTSQMNASKMCVPATASEASNGTVTTSNFSICLKFQVPCEAEAGAGAEAGAEAEQKCGESLAQRR